jgi:hypothetical protein
MRIITIITYGYKVVKKPLRGTRLSDPSAFARIPFEHGSG